MAGVGDFCFVILASSVGFLICFGFWVVSFLFSSSYPYLLGATSLSKCIISLQVATSLFISAVTFTIHHSPPELRFI